MTSTEAKITPAAYEMQLLRETMQLIRDYRTDSQTVINELSSQNQKHGKYPYRVYFEILTSLYPEYSMSTASRRISAQSAVKFLDKFIADKTNGVPRLQRWYGMLLNGEDPQLFTENELNKLQEAEAITDETQKDNAFHEVLDEKTSQESHQESEEKAEHTEEKNSHSSFTKESTLSSERLPSEEQRIEVSTSTQITATNKTSPIETITSPLLRQTVEGGITQTQQSGLPQIPFPIAKFASRYTKPDKLLAPAKMVLSAVQTGLGGRSPGTDDESGEGSDSQNAPAQELNDTNEEVSSPYSPEITESNQEDFSEEDSFPENYGGNSAQGRSPGFRRLSNPSFRRAAIGRASAGRAAASGAARLAARRTLFVMLGNPIVLSALMFVFLVIVPLIFFPIVKSSAELPFYENAFDRGSSTQTNGGASTQNGVCPTQAQIDRNAGAGKNIDQAINECNYLNPAVNILSTSFSDSQLNSYTSQYYPSVKSFYEPVGGIAEFTKRARYIIQESQKAGLNPIVLLGYWRTESLFSAYPNSSDLGCNPGDPNYKGLEKQVTCALTESVSIGCAVSRDANSPKCKLAKSIITQNPKIYTQPPAIPISTFDDLAELYGPRHPDLEKNSSACQTQGGDACKNRNCVHTYSQLLEVISVGNACTAPVTPATPKAPPAPEAQLALCAEITKKFNINFTPCNNFPINRLNSAWEIFHQAQFQAPNFFKLTGTVNVQTHAATSERSGQNIFFSTLPGSFYMNGSNEDFKVLIIHELGHVIRGNGKYDTQLKEAVNRDRATGTGQGYLTNYGENPCYGTSNIDEDFSETVAYYINKGVSEKNLGCGTKSSGGNPLESGKYPAHLQVIQNILGKPGG